MFFIKLFEISTKQSMQCMHNNPFFASFSPGPNVKSMMLTCFGTFGTSTSALSTFYLALSAFGTGFLSTNSKERWSYLALFVTSAMRSDGQI